MGRSHTPYAALCAECNHLASDHRWDSTAGGDLLSGPYVCPCGCSQSQEGPWLPLSKREYESYIRAAIKDPTDDR